MVGYPYQNFVQFSAFFDIQGRISAATEVSSPRFGLRKKHDSRHRSFDPGQGGPKAFVAGQTKPMQDYAGGTRHLQDRGSDAYIGRHDRRYGATAAGENFSGVLTSDLRDLSQKTFDHRNPWAQNNTCEWTRTDWHLFCRPRKECAEEINVARLLARHESFYGSPAAAAP